jgi:hypothetical protein
MALLNFPDNPLDGQLYPNPCPTGSTQYRWDTAVGIWRIVGVATGVNPGTYGNAVTVGQFGVDVTGTITFANNVPIQSASTTLPGIVQLNDTTDSISITQALTARAGRALQQQIGNLNNCIVPQRGNVVEALNDLQRQSNQLQTDALIWCGYYNAEEGDISYVSIIGQRLGYIIGQELPVPGVSNGGDFFIVNKAGNPYIAGDYNAPDAFIEIGDWILSETVRWSEVNAKGGKIMANDVGYVPSLPLTANNVQNAIFQITQLFRTGIGGATISEEKPTNPYPGQLWWDDNEGIFYIFYTDSNSSQWVELGGGGSQGLNNAGSGTVYEVRTGVGLLGGPITTEGEIYLQPAFVSPTPELSAIGGVIPRRGFNYSNASGALDLRITGDYTGKDPDTAFSQEGANILNAKIDAASGSNILAGTYDAKLGVLVYVTPAGLAKGLLPGENLPAPSAALDNYYVIVTIGGDIGPDGPEVSAAGDWYICQADQVPAIWFLIDFEQSTAQAVNVAVTPIPGIEFAGNAQRALEAIELQVQDRIEFAEATTDGLQIAVSPPGALANDGTTLSIGLSYASIADRGIVQLTNSITGNSETLAPTQLAVSQLNSKVQALVGANVLAGTYNSNTGKVASTTPAGSAAGLIIGQQAPAASALPDNYYLIVTVTGGLGPPGAVIPPAGVQSGDWFVVEKEGGLPSQWVTIDFENVTVTATQVNLAPVPGLSATNVQTGIEQIQLEVNEAITDATSSNNGITVAKTPINAGVGFSLGLTLNPATATDAGGVFVAPNNGLNLSPSGGLSIAPPTATSLGGVKAGDNITIATDGTISSSGGGSGSGELKIIDNITPQFNGSQLAFTLKIAGSNLPTSTIISSLLINIGGVNQTPTSAFTWNGASSTITFTSAPPTGATFDGRVAVDIGGSVNAGVTSITFTAPLTGGTISDTGTVGITDASASQRGTMTAAQFTKLATLGTNGNGTRTVSTSQPTGGSDGDIWYVV